MNRLAAALLVVSLLGPTATWIAKGEGTAPVAPVLHRPLDPSRLPPAEPGARVPPGGAEIVNPAEFCRAHGLLIAWPGWEQALVCDVVYEIARDDFVYVLVRDAAMEANATAWFEARGVNMGNVVFVQEATVSGSSMWIRDYGPFCAYEDGAEAIVDFRYGTYPGDDQLPLVLANYFGLPYYGSQLIHHGGNHITDGHGMAFGSTNFWEYNPGFTHAEVRGELRDYLGIDSLVVVEPMQGDLTGHIDMFCKLLNDTLFVVGEYADSADAYPGDFTLLNNLAVYLGGLQNLQGRDFAVARLPMCPIQYGGPAGTTNRTYTNSLIFNDKVLVPVYGVETDGVALAIYQELMPEHEIIGIDAATIIEYAGAIHCMTNTLHDPNPLIVQHLPVTSYISGSAPSIRFELVPSFTDTEAAVFYKPASAPTYTEVPAVPDRGAWSVLLPPLEEDFRYYVVGTANPGGHPMAATLPPEAPGVAFAVEAIEFAGTQPPLAMLEEVRITPNPIRSRAEILLQTVSPARVRAAIYDLVGRRVRTVLTATTLGTGEHRLTWTGVDDRGRPLPAGTYWCRIAGGGHSQTVRLLLVR